MRRVEVEAKMFRLLVKLTYMQFWASPHHSMDVLINNWGSVRGDRNAFNIKVLHPALSGQGSPESPPKRTGPPIPTDVPVREPHDVPVPEPIDVPPPNPGELPPATKPFKQPAQDPKPRPVP